MIYQINKNENQIKFGFKYSDVTKQAKRQGCQILRHGKGSHDIFVRYLPDGTKLESVLPNHRGDIPKGTLKSFCNKLGIQIK
jgi:predicted RNA binding protein YcfA (HicA-like mRNA interferase family)